MSTYRSSAGALWYIILHYPATPFSEKKKTNFLPVMKAPVSLIFLDCHLETPKGLNDKRYKSLTHQTLTAVS